MLAGLQNKENMVDFFLNPLKHLTGMFNNNDGYYTDYANTVQ